MIELFSKLGYQISTKDDLSNKEFRLTSSDFSKSEDSVMNENYVNWVEVYELFLTEGTYTSTRMINFIKEAKSYTCGDVDINVVRQENGYFCTITINFTE